MNKEYIDLKRRTVYRGDVYQAIENERIKVLSDVLISPYDNGVHDGLKKALVALANNVNDIPTADVVDVGYKVFAEWVARIIFNGGLEDESFCELACRKLNDLGIVEKTENEWHFDDPVKSITPAHLVEKRHGRWINAYPEIEPNPMFMYGICSVCGFEQSLSDKLKYCPNCGSVMDGGASDDAKPLG